MGICVVLLECFLALSGVNSAEGTSIFSDTVKCLQLLICFSLLLQIPAARPYPVCYSIPLNTWRQWYWDDVIERIAILSAKEMLSLQAQLSLFHHVDASMLS